MLYIKTKPFKPTNLKFSLILKNSFASKFKVQSLNKRILPNQRKWALIVEPRSHMKSYVKRSYMKFSHFFHHQLNKENSKEDKRNLKNHRKQDKSENQLRNQ